LVGTLGEIHAKGVDLYLHQQGIDTSTPAGNALHNETSRQPQGGVNFQFLGSSRADPAT
jgi:hypothetical protein